MYTKRVNTLLSFFLAAKSIDKDVARREFILNVLLCGSLFLSFVAACASWGETFAQGLLVRPQSLVVSVVLIFFLIAYFFSRQGKARIIAPIFIFAYLLIALFLSYKWGVDVPQALLTYALIIVMSGILVSSRFAFGITLVIAAALIFLTYNYHLFSVDLAWKSKPTALGDSFVYSATLLIIASISWLFNHEMEKSLQRARNSEKALKQQRDNLELLVEERTRQLKLAQAEKMVQLYRFSEFGRMASGLFHDLATPLGLVSLNLDMLSEKSKSIKHQEITDILKRAMVGTKQLENFVLTAKKQMQQQEVLREVSLDEHIKQVIQMLSYKARTSHTQIVFTPEASVQMFTSPVKFDQVVTNLVTNAIDAYEDINRSDKKVVISLNEKNGFVHVTVTDWGCGIKEADLSTIFDPLFTTKSFQKGTGMGLAICKDIVVKDLKGEIKVKSTLHKGTTFTIIFPIQHQPVGKIKKEAKGN